jgi:hypothetical protein
MTKALVTNRFATNPIMITARIEPTAIRIGPVLYGSTKLGVMPGGGIMAGPASISGVNPVADISVRPKSNATAFMGGKKGMKKRSVLPSNAHSV